MPDDNATRWTVSVSKSTDIALRTFLAQRGMKKGDLSRFVEEAVQWRVLDKTISEARTQFEDMPADELQQLIDEATESVRGDIAAIKPCE